MTQTDEATILNAAIAIFLEVLRAGWTPLCRLASQARFTSADEMLADWSQSNWEMIVEAAVSSGKGIYLEPYGEGADCNDVGSRTWMPGRASTHAVHCVPRGGARLRDTLMQVDVEAPRNGFSIDQFVSRTEEGWYVEAPPFDHVLVQTKNSEVMFPLSDVSFILHPTGSE